VELVEIIALLPTLSVLCSAICAATPTPKDDAIYAKYIYPAIEYIALNFGKAKE
jgi:hypothetical protein